MGAGIRLIQKALEEPGDDKKEVVSHDPVLVRALKAVLTEKIGAELVSGGKADRKPDSKYSPKQMAIGKKVEREHTSSPAMAKEIAKDHLEEFGNYYTELQKMESRLEKNSAILVKMALEDTRPYRERAELIARLKNKIMAFEFSDNNNAIGFPGGGVDPGEDPARSAAREFFEEGGYKAKNVRASGVPPVLLEWTPEMIANSSNTLRERAKTFRGSKTHFFLGDVAGKQQHEDDLDVRPGISSTRKIWLAPHTAIKRLQTNHGLDTKFQKSDIEAIHAARIQAIRNMLTERAT